MLVMLGLMWPGAACLGATVFERDSSGMTVLASCTIDTPKIISFAAYTGVRTDSTNIIVVRCTQATFYNVGLDAGRGPGAQVTTRKMIGPNGATLRYALFRDEARALNWGDTLGVDTLSGFGAGANIEQHLVVYGRLPAGQFCAEPGKYSDVVQMTISY
jgi:spore coat protein U-like protein